MHSNHGKIGIIFHRFPSSQKKKKTVFLGSKSKLNLDWAGLGLNNIKQNMSWTFKNKKKTNRMDSMGFEPVTITCKHKDSTTKLGVNLLHLLH